MLGTAFLVTYYTVLIAITLLYLFSSFQTILPWTVCDLEWPSVAMCYSSAAAANGTSDATNMTNVVNTTGLKSSSALFFS